VLTANTSNLSTEQITQRSEQQLLSREY
jgi:hypothetical protein